MKERYIELDSVRGLAAVTVILHHFFLIFPAMILDTLNNSKYNLVNIVKYSPLHIFWAGHEAVIMFFLLSGFVLSLPFYNGSELKYSKYIVKRITRIYIPYLASVIIAVLCIVLFSRGNIFGLSSWFNATWNKSIDWHLFVEHLFLINHFSNGQFNPVYWSLVHEMRISLVFPLIMFFIIRWKWMYSLGVSFLISFIGFLVSYKVNNTTDYFATLQYILIFVVGALLAKHRIEIMNYFKSLANKLKVTLIVFSIFLYTFGWWGHILGPLYNAFSVDFAIMIGAAIFLIFSLTSGVISNFLKTRPVNYLGKISYSLYLYHCIVLFSLIHILYNSVNIGVILLFSIILTLLVSSLAYYLIEIPSIKLGRFLTQNRSEKFIQDKKTA